MGLPPKVVIPIVTVFTVLFLAVMGYFLKVGFFTAGSAFGPGVVRSQGDANLQATPAPVAVETDAPGTVNIPQTGTGPQGDGGGPPPGNAVGGGGGPPAPVMALLNELHARLEKNPDDIAALVALGNLYFDASKFDQAVTYYQKALKLDPGNPDVRNDEGAALHASGHDLEALREIDRVLTERPNFPQALFNRGVVLRSMGRRSDAVAAYRAYLKAAPSDPHAADAKAAIGDLGG